MPLPNAGRNPISRFGEPGCPEEVVSVKIEFLVGTSAGFVPAASACQLPIGDNDVAPSTPAIGVLVRDIPGCSSASADGPVGIAARILSASTPDAVDVALASLALPCGHGQLDFSRRLNDLHKGPWEVLAPRSSSLGGDAIPLRGASVW
jgi:hypothetical protein